MSITSYLFTLYVRSYFRSVSRPTFSCPRDANRMPAAPLGVCLPFSRRSVQSGNR